MSESLEAGDIVALLRFNRSGAVDQIEVGQVRMASEQVMVLDLVLGCPTPVTRVVPASPNRVRLICKAHEVALPSDVGEGL